MKKSLVILIFLLSLSTWGQGQNANDATFSEYEIKAAFLYNFAKFVDWPEEVFADSTKSIRIGVLGKDPFGEILDETIANKIVKGKPLSIKRFSDAESMEYCHILFISSSEREDIRDIIAGLANMSILTVGDMDKFAEQGGIINLFNQDNKVRFNINLDAAERANLRISSRLLKLAEIVFNSRTNGKSGDGSF